MLCGNDIVSGLPRLTDYSPSPLPRLLLCCACADGLTVQAPRRLRLAYQVAAVDGGNLIERDRLAQWDSLPLEMPPEFPDRLSDTATLQIDIWEDAQISAVPTCTLLQYSSYLRICVSAYPRIRDARRHRGLTRRPPHSLLHIHSFSQLEPQRQGTAVDAVGAPTAHTLSRAGSPIYPAMCSEMVW